MAWFFLPFIVGVESSQFNQSWYDDASASFFAKKRWTVGFPVGVGLENAFGSIRTRLSYTCTFYGNLKKEDTDPPVCTYVQKAKSLCIHRILMRCIIPLSRS